MNNSVIFLPVRLVDLLRRLVNAISTLSLTHHYLLAPRHPDTPTPPSWSWPRSVYSPELASLGWRVYSSPTVVERAPRSETNPPDGPPSLQPTRLPDNQRSPPPPLSPPGEDTERLDTIHRLMMHPTLFDPARAPRYPIVLCHGLYGFDVRGPAAFPSLRLHYWSSVLSILKYKLGAEVIVTGVPPTGSIALRADHLDRILQQKARGRGVNLMAHSMGGLDGRHLITHIRPTEYVPLSLTSISTPHRGSPFMDWCAQYLGLGRRQSEPNHPRQNDSARQVQPESDPTLSADSDSASEKRETLRNLPSSFTTLLLSLLDSPAYANLTTSYLNDVFNPSTPNDSRVKYFSVGSRVGEMNIWHPLWFPKMVLDDAERKARERLKAAAGANPKTNDSALPLWEQEDEWGNDGLVTVQSARWGEFLGVLSGCDHWAIRGARGMELPSEVRLASGIGNITNRVAGEGWGLGDWSKFIGAWKREEKSVSDGLELAQATDTVPSRETNRDGQDGRNDPVVKASADKLSAVFDWIVEHVPTAGNTSSPKEKLPPKNDLATKFDLERFYVALTRKLYDEGL